MDEMTGLDRIDVIKDRIAMWIAWRLPRRVVKWAYMRVCAHATTREWENYTPGGTSIHEGAMRWEIHE
jgi:hypothetical protein